MGATERRTKVLTLAATALGSALAFLDGTVVIVALPRMEEDLGLGLAGQQWVVLGYALSLSALYLVSGAVGDRVGLRRTFVVGVVLFAAASMLCAAATSEATLIAGRALQGVGGAALTTTSLALLRVVWADEAGRAIGLWTSLTSVATIGGPPLGGLIVESGFVALGLPPQRAAGRRGGGARRWRRRPGEDRSGRSTLDLVGAGSHRGGLDRGDVRARGGAGERRRGRVARGGRRHRRPSWPRRLDGTGTRSARAPPPVAPCRGSPPRISSPWWSTRRSVRTCSFCRSTCSSSGSRRRFRDSRSYRRVWR